MAAIRKRGSQQAVLGVSRAISEDLQKCLEAFIRKHPDAVPPYNAHTDEHGNN
jgi:hypothetical protein